MEEFTKKIFGRDVEIHTVKVLPLFPPKECFRNCIDYMAKDENSLAIFGWMLTDVGNGEFNATYHCILKKAVKERVILVDITRNLSNYETIQFIIDQEFLKKKEFTIEDIEDLIRNRWCYHKMKNGIFSVPADYVQSPEEIESISDRVFVEKHGKNIMESNRRQIERKGQSSRKIWKDPKLNT
jgi:hypothetical protein